MPIATREGQDVSSLTKDAIFDKVMRGEHLTAEEKEFVRNGYRVVAAQTAPEHDAWTSHHASS